MHACTGTHNCNAVVCVLSLPSLLSSSPLVSPCSDKRGSGGNRIIAGSVLLRLSATPSPGCSRIGTYLQLACSYLVTPHTLSLHTSGVLENLGRDDRAAAAGQIVCEWLEDQGQAVVPEALVKQVRIDREEREEGIERDVCAICVYALGLGG